ncbi:M23 family metallopeptidase [Salinibacillus xinjiangensis]|uniref:Peptidoglycan DD-metalloendopeptidase family protein n=1 Tax=Salinibacillus xinjiangensis TaxID=1229268 RepID=A0A6G1X5J0_9BACI|nr:M23 family metallopeptidase [Salinibacillus xinjiangensis]MRG86175.1 peptidoglycan DD-metalloendopeptidase family protein [Salinibacillus xinjiangensis]
MKEEKNSTWSRLIRKKWFYPAVYLTFAALILTGVIWYQNTAIDLPDESADQSDQLDSEGTVTDPLGQGPDGESVPVVDQDELLKMPVASADDTEIVTKFYDYNASEEEQEQALILYNNKYYQSKGIDIASANDEPFDVTAALTGSVTEVKEDPLLGMVVELTHDNGVTTHYASLEEVAVESGQEVSQGDVLGTAGKNLYGQANGTHVHFEVRKDENPINPEDFFNKPISDIEAPKSDEKANEDEATEGEEGNNGEEATEEEETSGENSDENVTEEDNVTEDENVSEDGNEDDETGDDEEGDNAGEDESQSSVSSTTA